jgi:hypothetical protein
MHKHKYAKYAKYVRMDTHTYTQFGNQNIRHYTPFYNK